MGYKLSCIALNVTYIDENDKYKKIESVYRKIKDFKNIKRLNIDLRPSNWLEIYQDSTNIHKNGISYKPFYYNHIDETGDYGDREVWIWVYPQLIRFWIGNDATECLEWEHDLFNSLLEGNSIDTALILIPSSKYLNLAKGKITGKKNLLTLYAIREHYKGDKKDIIKFLLENEEIIYKNDQIISIDRSELKKILRQEKDGFFSPLIKKCFLFKYWF